MKPAPFEYIAPTSTQEALTVLTQFGDEAKLLAGGQSLIPTMNFRLAQPGVLIDLNPVHELSYILPTPSGGLRIGAMTRQRQVERSIVIAARAPLLAMTMPYVAHVQIRNRGTIGGSLAHADPAAELPAVMTAMDAVLVVQGPSGLRRIDISDFYLGLFTADLAPDEILTEIELPRLPDSSGYSMMEVARRHGDYALAGVAIQVEMASSGHCREARMVYFSVGEGPVVAQKAVSVLVGESPSREVIEEAAQQAASVDLDPPSDIHATARFRRQLALVLGRRALQEAFQRAAN